MVLNLVHLELWGDASKPKKVRDDVAIGYNYWDWPWCDLAEGMSMIIQAFKLLISRKKSCSKCRAPHGERCFPSGTDTHLHLKGRAFWWLGPPPHGWQTRLKHIHLLPLRPPKALVRDWLLPSASIIMVGGQNIFLNIQHGAQKNIISPLCLPPKE